MPAAQKATTSVESGNGVFVYLDEIGTAQTTLPTQRSRLSAAPFNFTSGPTCLKGKSNQTNNCAC